MPNLNKLSFICPNCSFLLQSVTTLKKCPQCSKKITLLNEKTISFIDNQEIQNDGLDKIKYCLKKYPTLYNFLIATVSPVCPNLRLNSVIKRYLNKDLAIINMGSGNTKLAKEILNLDFINFQNVDIVADMHHIPIKSETIDVIINIATLEHLKEPELALKEFHRILKINGTIITMIPFMQGFHASPYDFQRWTKSGIKQLHKDFYEEITMVSSGPTSGILWIIQEWLAIVFSFGSSRLHQILLIIFMVILFPVKFLDIILIKHPSAKNIASGFIFVGKKLTSKTT